MPSEAKTRPAILPMHSQNYSSLCKRSYKKACRRATEAQQPVAYRGQQLTQLQVRRSGNCPPRHSDQQPRRPPRAREGLSNPPVRELARPEVAPFRRVYIRQSNGCTAGCEACAAIHEGRTSTTASTVARGSPKL